MGAKTRESILGLYHKTAEMKVREHALPPCSHLQRPAPAKRGSV